MRTLICLLTVVLATMVSGCSGEAGAIKTANGDAFAEHPLNPPLTTTFSSTDSIAILLDNLIQPKTEYTLEIRDEKAMVFTKTWQESSDAATKRVNFLTGPFPA